MPSRAIGHQRVPPPRPPHLRNPAFLKHQMVNAVGLQMLAHRDPGLTGADNQRINGFY